jgi:NADH-quinone oxidoreductase subunit G/NADP-reducing hydrogenase subunit HndD
MVNLTINNQKIVAEEGLTIMEAAKRNHIRIPSLCYMKDVHQMGACRICVVEVEGAKTLQASCLRRFQKVWSSERIPKRSAMRARCFMN